jgi:hypothetical protein
MIAGAVERVRDLLLFFSFALSPSVKNLFVDSALRCRPKSSSIFHLSTLSSSFLSFFSAMLKVTAAAGEKKMAVAEKWGSRALPLPKSSLSIVSLFAFDSRRCWMDSLFLDFSAIPSAKWRLATSEIFVFSSLSRFARWLRPFNSSSFPSGVDAPRPSQRTISTFGNL